MIIGGENMIKIAIVDDSIDYIRFIYDKVDKIMKDLNYDQYEIKTFTDGIKLIESDTKFDLLLLDIDMPTIDGFNLAKKISNNIAALDNATIIYISTYDNLVYESFKYSPLRFIRKNRINEELCEAIQAFLEKRQYSGYSLMFSTDLGKKVLR